MLEASIFAGYGVGRCRASTTAPAGRTFPEPLVATVTDTAGQPASGASVTFTVTSGSAAFAGGATTATVTTGTDGQAMSPALQAGDTTGPVTVTAATPGVGATASYSETVIAAIPATVTATSGDGQSTAAGTAFAQPLVATVADTTGQPAAGTDVEFAVTSGSASFPGGASSVTVTADADGRATSTSVPAGFDTGPVVVRATVPYAASAIFVATVTRPVPAAITATSGSGQSAVTGTAFGKPLVATVTNTLDDQVAGAAVTFTVTDGAATFPAGASTATVTTDDDGQATAPTLTAGAVPGPVTVTATTPGVAGSRRQAVSKRHSAAAPAAMTGSATYSLTVTAAPAPSTSAPSGSTTTAAGPTAAGPTTTSVAPSTASGSNPLAVTGAPALTLTALAAIFVLGGTMLLGLARRRRVRRH